MRNLRLIIRREYLARVRNRSFIIMTFLSPMIFILMVLVIAYLISLSGKDTLTVGIHDASGLFVKEFQESQDLKFQDFSILDLEDAKRIVQETGYYGLLSIPSVEDGRLTAAVEFHANEAPAFGFLEGFEEVLSGALTRANLVAMGVDVAVMDQAEERIAIEVHDFSGKRTSELTTYVKMFFGGAAGYLLMMFIIIYGNMVMRSVIEEKTNRIVEIIISSVRPIELMFGKILGTSFAGMTQFIIWVLLGAGMLMGFVAFSAAGWDVPQLSTSTAEGAMFMDTSHRIAQDIMKLPLISLSLYFLVYFLCGYFLYSSIYAAIGAAVDNETDTQQFIFPLILPQMMGIYVGFFSVMGDPHGTVATIFSIFPLTSPIVMLMRIPFGVPWWEIAGSLVLLVISIGAVVWVASKIYRIGILTYGKKPSYKDLWKWLRY